jgi:O-succinylbenzoic acid--CoA ligase
VSCAEPIRRARRFPLELRAARTPDAPALLWAADPGNASSFGEDAASVSPVGKGGPRGSGETVSLRATSFRDLDRRTRAISSALGDRGVARGETVGLLLPPGPAYPELLLALLRLGAVALPLSTRLPPGALADVLRRAGCRRLIGEAASCAPAGVDALDAAALLAADSPNQDAALTFDRGAPATIVLTSGSSGVPKAALHSFENHWASAVGANRNLPLRPGDRWLLSLPLWHVGGLAVVFRCLQAGAAVAVAAPGQPLAHAIAALGVTHLSLVATQLFRLLRDPRGREALRATKAVLLGGGPVPFPLIEEADRLGVRLIASYGSTETASQATATRPGDPVALLATAGRALPFREIAVAGGGEILARGRTLFLGYVDAAGLRDARDGAGWFHTGDLGWLDGAGRLVVVGRRDAMFISGGENIHPEEIEREILRFPGVLAAIVVPVPDAEFGARPAAFVRTASGAPPDPRSLDAFLRAALPGFKVPARYLAWPQVEEGLKPDRRALAALAASAPADPQAAPPR